MMTRRMLAVAVTVAVAGCIFACSRKGVEAKGIQDEAQAPKTMKEFSADIVTTTPMGEIKGKLYVSEDKSRVEMPQTTMITRLDKGVVWVLMPTKMYIEQPVTPDSTAGFMDELPEGAQRSFVAEEELRGKRVKKFKVAVTDEGNVLPVDRRGDRHTAQGRRRGRELGLRVQEREAGQAGGAPLRDPGGLPEDGNPRGAVMSVYLNGVNFTFMKPVFVMISAIMRFFSV